jgi:hypothetical protein
LNPKNTGSGVLEECFKLTRFAFARFLQTALFCSNLPARLERNCFVKGKGKGKGSLLKGKVHPRTGHKGSDGE